MRLKPRSTVKNPRAMVYKRFTAIEQSESLAIVYQTDSDGLFWTFDNEKLQFDEIDAENMANSEIRHVRDFYTVFSYEGHYFRYNGVEWEETTEPNSANITLLSATFNNIAKYQTNKYYYVGSFDYMVKGSISGTTTQFVKGNIIPLTSLNIKYFDDYINLSVDDLVVIDGHLYSVENPETSIKQMPKPFKVYFATLNSIL